MPGAVGCPDAGCGPTLGRPARSAAFVGAGPGRTVVAARRLTRRGFVIHLCFNPKPKSRDKEEPEIRHLNTPVPDEIPGIVRDLRKASGWTENGQVVTAAIDALAYLLERHDKAIARSAEDGVEQDVLDLFKRVSRVLPARLVDDRVDWGRLSDGRPALILNQEWVIADDGAGDLMAVRHDGNEVGYLARGDIQPLAERALAGEVRPLQAVDRAALN
jgi:hypothetical protein